jgi:hypothetical protein
LIPENELSVGAGVELDPRTGGPFVDETRQTSVPGIFACGNVVHVHDLVDFVVEESEIAGRGAAEYMGGYSRKGLGQGKSEDRNGSPIQLRPGEGVKYLVPQRVQGTNGEDRLDLYLRVNRVYGKSSLHVKDGGQVIKQVKRSRMNPGEMERLRLNKATMEKIEGSELTVEAVEVGG